MPPSTYHTLEEIQQRKTELQAGIQEESSRIGTLWHQLFAPQQAASKGEFVAHLVANSVTAIDGFLLVRKLMKSYGYLFGKRKKRK